MIFEKQIIGTFRNNFLRRCDDTGTAFYFSAADFPGLEAEPFSFPSCKGHELKGYFYHYDDPIPGRIVVFDHGFGGGHRSYMKEIELLCRHGYLVFSYDHTGCMESGGDPSKKESGVKAFFDGLIQAVDFLDEVVQVRRSKTQSKSAEKILEYVTENLCDNTLSLSQISDALGLHRSYLSNIFKAAYGETLSSYIEQLRIEKARDMIKNTDMKIWDIAEAVGYTSDTSFRRAFKRITGFTPGEYRERD